MAWYDVYDYENEADKYIRRDLERSRQAELSKTWKQSPVSIGSDVQAKWAAHRETSRVSPGTPVLEPMGSGGAWQNVPSAPKPDDTEALYSKYEYNVNTIFQGLKKPEFGKVKTVKTQDAGKALSTFAGAMGLVTLRRPMEVYKFKTKDQKTGESVIVPQSKIKVVAENKFNFYYYQDSQLKSVAKDEVSLRQLGTQEIEEMYMDDINKKAENIRKLPGDKFQQAPEPGLVDKAKDFVGEVGDTVKSAAYGFGRQLSRPIDAVADKMLQSGGPFAHDEEYFKQESFKLQDGKLPEDVKSRIDARRSLETEEFPKGFSEETDAIARNATSAEIAAAREQDRLSGKRVFMNKEADYEFSQSEEVAEVVGEITGIMTELLLGNKAAGVASGAIKAKKMKTVVNDLVVGGGFGLLEKLKERDATAMDYVKSGVKEALFFGAGGKASGIVKDAIGPTKSAVGRIGKVAAGGATFGAAGTAASLPFVDKEERTLKRLGTDTAFGAAFDIGASLGGKGLGRALGKSKSKVLSKINPEITKKYSLDVDVRKLNSKQKAELETKVVKSMLKDIGTSVKKQVGSTEPRKVLDHYIAKYDLAPKNTKIKFDKTLTGEKNFARIEKSGNVLELRVNPKKTENEIVAAIRHEVEHLRDIKAGFKSKDVTVKRPKNVSDLLSKRGHHSNYDNFEIGYLEKMLKDTDNFMNGSKKSISTSGSVKRAIDTVTNYNVKRKTAILKQLGNKNLNPDTRARLSKELKTITSRERLSLETQGLGKESFSSENLDGRRKVVAEAGNLPDYEPPKSTLKGSVREKAESFYSYFLDAQRGISRTGKSAKERIANFRKYHGTVDYINTENLVGRNGKKIGDNALIDVLKAPKGYQQDYGDYLLVKHHISRMKQGKPVVSGNDGRPISISRAEELVREYETNMPEFKKYGENLNQFLDDFMREYAIDGDLITQKLYRDMKRMYPDFVPTLRVKDAGGVKKTRSSRIGGSPIKKATGGVNQLVPMEQSVPEYVKGIVRAQRRNSVYQSLLEQIVDNPRNMQKFAEIHNPKKNRKELQSVLDSMTNPETMDELMKGLDGGLHSDIKGNFLVVLEKGKPVTLKINDGMLWKTLKEMNRTDITNTEQVVKKFNSLLTQNFKNVITVYNPKFALRNIARDLPTAYIQGSVNNPITFANNLRKSIQGILGKSELFEQFKALGGSSSNITAIEKKLNPSKATKILEYLNMLGSFTETVPRFAEFQHVYKKGIKKGKSEQLALQEALYGAGEVTVDFSRGGDVTKKADTFFPYMNAGTQGLDKWFRTLVTDGIKKKNLAPIIKSLGVVTVPTMALTFMNHALFPEKYKELPDYVRDNNYVVPVGETEYLKVPKNRETGFIFSTLFDRLHRHFVEGDEEAFKLGGILEAFSTSFYNPATDLISGGLAGPVINIKAGGNKDYFGRNIEPLAMVLDKRSKSKIFDEKTSQISLAVAPVMELMGVSPKQTDYLVKSYLGIISEFYMAWNNEDDSLLDKSKNIAKKGYFHNLEYSSKSQSAVYDAKDEAAQTLRDFEIDNGIVELKKQLTEDGITSTKTITRKIESHLGFSKLKEYRKLQEAKKELN